MSDCMQKFKASMQENGSSSIEQLTRNGQGTIFPKRSLLTSLAETE